MVREILFLARSTSRTFTSTISPTLTASRGCLIKRSVIWEICTRPSWWTPISTKTPKSITFRTVPLRIMPGFRSFMSSTSLRRMGAGMSSLGSLAGFSSSLRMSVRVISPIPSSSAIFFLSRTRRSRLAGAVPAEAAAPVSVLPAGAEAAFLPAGSS